MATQDPDSKHDAERNCDFPDDREWIPRRVKARPPEELKALKLGRLWGFVAGDLLFLRGVVPRRSVAVYNWRRQDYVDLTFSPRSTMLKAIDEAITIFKKEYFNA